MTTTLDAAVADGTISREAAAFGLSHEDVVRLARSPHADASLLVRLRNATGDCRIITTAQRMATWTRAETADRVATGNCVGDPRRFGLLDVLDVFGAASRSQAPDA
ncbi:hypothetical protein EPN42_04600 [bacterium]|nr:MAG: hypothetical protein EPN42_04600 [bacterium]